MAYYDGTYSCGHDGRVDITGPSKSREWKRERAFSGLCPKCREEERQLENRKAAEKSRELELPVLTGSEKQVAWANTLRLKVIEKYESRLTEEISDSEAELISAMDYILENRTDAGFWIDNRDRNDILFLILRMYEKSCRKEAVPDDVKQELADLQEQLTVIPDTDNKKKGIVELKYKEDGELLSAEYIKDCNFIDTVKNLGYRWDGKVWSKRITEYTGAIDERAAELGNTLLSEGYTVRFPNESARDAAISGTFIPENGRWIIWVDGRLAITWQGRNDTLYEKARNLPGAAWRARSMRVNVEYYREVQDFAEVMGFNISRMASGKIAAYMETENRYLHEKIEPASTARDSRDKQLEKALKSDGTIISDLLDD